MKRKFLKIIAILLTVILFGAGIVVSRKCAEADCLLLRSKSLYCSEHENVYQHEREFYSEVQKVINSFKNEYSYSVTSNCEIEEMIVSYRKSTEKGKLEYGLPDYTLTIYIYYKLNGVDKFAKYDEYVHLFGMVPKIENCAEETYTSYRRVAMGGSESNLYHNKLRAKHYKEENPLGVYTYDEFFIVNFDDYLNQGYEM